MGLILADTVIWADHFRSRDRRLEELIAGDGVAAHPYVIGELALGHLARPRITINWLVSLPRVEPVSEEALYAAVERYSLQGSGLGFVDAHLLAAVEARPDLQLWTRDKRLAACAEALDVAYAPV